MLSTLQDAETGERGYVITGAPEFLEPYECARQMLEFRQMLELQLERLSALVDDCGQARSVRAAMARRLRTDGVLPERHRNVPRARRSG